MAIQIFDNIMYKSAASSWIYGNIVIYDEYEYSTLIFIMKRGFEHMVLSTNFDDIS